MIFLLSILAALALSAIPIAVGWRRTYSESAMARQMGLAVEKRRFDPEKFALQTGTGLTWNQILYGFAAWVVGGFAAGLTLGPFVAVLFALAGGALYRRAL